MKQFLYLVTFIILFSLSNAQNQGCTQNAFGTPGNCLCNQGFYGAIAEVGGFCKQCPSGSTTPTPSNQPDGNSNINTAMSICNQCQVNYYMAVAANQTTPSPAQCSPCPAGTGNLSGPTVAGDISQCNICLPNYYMTAISVSGSNGATAQSAKCSPCPPNTGNLDGASTAGDVSQCNLCSQNYYMTQDAIPSSSGINPSAAQCLPCPTGSGNTQPPSSSGDISQCNVCQNNYYMNQAAVTASSGSIATAAVCTICPHGSGNSPGPNSPGDISQCNQCQAGYYMTQLAASNGVNSSAAQCSPCPANSTSQPTSTINTISSCQCFDPNAAPINTNQTSCICANGYFGVPNTSSNQVSGCFPCDIDQYSTKGASCTTCAMGSLVNSDSGGCTCIDVSIGTLPWSADTNTCQCKQNYYGSPSRSTIGQTGSCLPCPNGTTSAVGSQLITDCQGYVATTFQKIITVSILFIFLMGVVF
ncbi:immobilization antigen (macronuclear) [Tetrahymena thermophila SB210]|uniref:Immobilization antigen n=1 Tax=Tetrahymena thermophila (strain SB210) TaxID=312017 RepID=Q22PD4_TETTS|nr:immobilization antigen [Tetrahymena thermophila SB210]EAR87175.1 immobilization antigen [Tetrahymena thermophila SB210]|eukprot:XP_001007420.1 immobilization antigen [Tetrahymena thermophila SB210]